VVGGIVDHHHDHCLDLNSTRGIAITMIDNMEYIHTMYIITRKY
jgi:hypothetical protein